MSAADVEQCSVVPFPPPTVPGQPCATCAGQGVTGERYRFQAQPTDQPLLVDVLCPRCSGCGRAEHDDETCTAPEHGDDLDDEDEDLDDVTDLGELQPCWQCRGRGWWTCQGWRTAGDRPVDEEVLTLRMPCGCSSARVGTVTVTPA